MLDVSKFFVNFQYFHKIDNQKYVFTPKTLIITKYKYQREEKVEPENSM